MKVFPGKVCDGVIVLEDDVSLPEGMEVSVYPHPPSEKDLQKQGLAPSLRPFGLCEGEFMVPDDFDVTLPEDILDSFEGK